MKRLRRPPLDPDRRTGRTLRQLQAMPQHGLYIWCSPDLSYPQALALHLHRSDIQIHSTVALTSQLLLGKTYSAIIIDHACKLTPEQQLGYQRLLPLIRE